MNVAIMGAGLSCAITLERYGITPTIFSKRTRVGDRFVNAEAMFSIHNRPTKNWLPYIEENYRINLKPIDEVDKLFSLVLRKFMESLTDDDIDFGVKNSNNKIIDKLVDKICSNNSSIELHKLSTPLMSVNGKLKGYKR